MTWGATTLRATIDANVLVVAPLGEISPPALIYDAWQAGRFELVISEYILVEIARTHLKPYFSARLSNADITNFENLLRRRATIVPITAVVQGVATHPEDDRILATALSGGADYLVTGDHRFRARVPSFRGISLVSPADFLQIIGWPP